MFKSVPNISFSSLDEPAKFEKRDSPTEVKISSNVENETESIKDTPKQQIVTPGAPSHGQADLTSRKKLPLPGKGVRVAEAKAVE